ncbi:MAG: FtsX-like permease family protein [Lentisphaeria bacterium]|nr:FtsX-like permease family protein [Lentisphaeria bacterium]
MTKGNDKVRDKVRDNMRDEVWNQGRREGGLAVCLALVICGMFWAVPSRAGEVYRSVFAELTRHEHRLPGSDAYQASLECLERALRAAGLETHRQTFDTLAPETRECRLVVDGEPVQPVYALGPNGIANNTLGDKELRGPIVWLGNGTLEEMKGRPVAGSIAVLRFASPNMLQVFSQGARAIIFVGNGRETQWQAREQFTELDVELPRLFIHEDAARQFGLLDDRGQRQASLSLTTVWKDVQGVNLWAEIPGEAGASFAFGTEEAMVLSAIFDTFGTVPEQSPGERAAANCALLAEVAADLARRPLKRSVFVVFLGSHYAGQDGARMFYYALRRGSAELADRENGYREALEDASQQLAALSAEDFFGEEHPGRDKVARSLDKRLTGKVSTLNYELRNLRIQLAGYRRRETLLPADQAAVKQLETDEARLTTQRTDLNNLRRQLYEQSITDKDGFAAIAAEEHATVRRQVSDLENLLLHNRAHRELADAVGGKRIMGHYDFDFAEADEDWTLTIDGIGSQMFYHSRKGKWAEVKIGDFVKHMRVLSALAEKDDLSLFTKPADALLFPGRFCVPSIRSVPSRVAHALQIYGYQMVTVGNSLDGDALPYRQSVDLEGLSPQLASFCADLGNDASLSISCPLAKPKFHNDTVMHFRGEGGFRYLYFARGSTDIAGVPENGITCTAPRRSQDVPYVAGHSYSFASRIRASGHIFIPLLYNNAQMRPLGFDDSGVLELFPSADGWGTTRLYYGHGGLLNLPFIPGKYGGFAGTLANGMTDSQLRNLYLVPGKNTVAFRGAAQGAFKAFEKDGLLLLGSTPENPQGQGLPLVDPPLYTLNVLRQTAHDYLTINEQRLQVLRDKAIVNDSLEGLQADAFEHWEAAADARADHDIPAAVAHEVLAASMAGRVATPLREVTNDMVRAVVLLLLLTIPFAFVMERLIFSATSIYRQVIGFGTFFVGTFALLYMVHPAFSIASAPVIIFLAFVIILLSVVVMAIVMSKFKKELRAMQGLSSSAHGVASDSSAGLAAILIGISGMRNRPLKTFLTALTIVLLTFAIVVFASFTPVIGVKETYLGKGNGPSRIELRRFSGLEIPGILPPACQTLYSDTWTTCVREALYNAPGSQSDGVLVAFNRPSKTWKTLKAMVAFDPREMAINPELAAAIPGFADYKGALPPIFLPSLAIESLGIARGDTIHIGGKPFVFAGEFDSGMIDQLSFMDGARMTPPDFESSLQEMGGTEESGDLDAQDSFVDPTRFRYFSSRDMGITVVGALDELARPTMAPGVNAIIMYADETADVEAAAAEIAKVFVGPVMAKGARGMNRFFFSKTMEASGFSVVIVPLLLGGLIIFNSLLGSIVERQKEIYTYSAMGLAPPDVGTLFFAESAVYAILGGMGGYLVSQLASRIVGLCGEWGLFVPPEMNFSSLTSVLTIFIVMAMVMVSTIYPALKAGRSANPGVARKWKMPVPAGDDIEFVFPFTVSAEDMGGIVAFIREHFENHGDSSLGCFAAADVRVSGGKESEPPGIRARISLAPFDLGVMQAFSIASRPSEIEDIDEVVVNLKRVSGTRGAWLRGNRVFIDNLREQFLLWRSLPVGTVAHYRSVFKELVDDQS